MSERPEAHLSQDQWAKILSLLQNTSWKKLGLKGGTQSGRPNPWHQPEQYRRYQARDRRFHDEPHWALANPRTGRLMTTAETDLILHRISGRPECLDWTCRHYLGPDTPAPAVGEVTPES